MLQRALERRRSGDRAATRRHADEEDGHQGDSTAARTLRETSARAHESWQSPGPIRCGNGPDLHPHGAGFVYLCAVVDWFSRKVLSWRLSITMEAAFCIEAVEEACPSWQAGNLQYRPRIAVHLHRLHRRALKRSQIAISMDGKGAWRDNVFVVERLWRSIKYEGSLPPCLQDCVRGTRWHRPISELLQHQTPTLALLQS